MNKFRKPFDWATTDTLRGTVRRDQLGMLLFELSQLLDQPIIFAIGNFRIVFKIVEIFVAANFVAQLFDLFLNRCFFSHFGKVGHRDTETQRKPLKSVTGSVLHSTISVSLRPLWLSILSIKQVSWPLLVALERAANQAGTKCS